MMTCGIERLMQEYWERGFKKGFKKTFQKSFKETYQEGFQEGIETVKMGRELLSHNYTVKEVMEKTGLTEEDVENIK